MKITIEQDGKVEVIECEAMVGAFLTTEGEKIKANNIVAGSFGQGLKSAALKSIPTMIAPLVKPGSIPAVLRVIANRIESNIVDLVPTEKTETDYEEYSKARDEGRYYPDPRD